MVDTNKALSSLHGIYIYEITVVRGNILHT